jgi:hypothetical protein
VDDEDEDMSEDDDSSKSPKNNGYEDGMRELDRESDTVRQMLGGGSGARMQSELRSSRRVVEEIGRFWDMMVIESGPGLLTQTGPWGSAPGPLGLAMLPLPQTVFAIS